MQKYRSQGRLAKIAVSGVVISLFSVLFFTPAVDSPTTSVIGQNINYFASNSHTMQAVFNVGVECIYLAEPVNGNVSKVQFSSRYVIPFFYPSSGFCANKLFSGKFIYFSDKIPRKSFRQVCLVLDLPPPFV
jgi:hypothetical protein